MAKKNTTHPVHIGPKVIKSLNTFLNKNTYSSYFILCDSNTLENCLSFIISSCPVLKEAEVIETEPGEDSKDISVVAHIWQTLADFGADKKALLINLGGGVISDLGGFAASTYKRGIDFINIPTSLMAMADASVGGKTGINFSGIKNSIGTITQPKAVFIHTAFLHTLPKKHLANGYAEIYKVALIRNKPLFNQICHQIISHKSPWDTLVKTSVDLKKKIVEKDPLEKGLRKILNFGHSAGHAIESLYLEKGRPLFHGEAVALGMCIESHIAWQKKRITKAQLQQIEKGLQLNFQLPELSITDQERILYYLKQDKKNSHAEFLFALLKGIGGCDFNIKVKSTELNKAFDYYNKNVAHIAS